MKKLFFSLIAAFALVANMSFAQDMWDHLILDNQDTIRVAEDEYGPGRIIFRVDSSFHKNFAPPVEFLTFSDDGKERSIAVFNEKTKDQMSLSVLVQTRTDISGARYYHFGVFSHRAGTSLILRYYPKKRQESPVLPAREGYFEQHDEPVILQDYRRIKPETKPSLRDTLLPVRFDTLYFEYEYDPYWTPDWVDSIDRHGRVHRKRFGFLDIGFQPGPGYTIAGVKVLATPHSVDKDNGIVTYRIALILRDGSQVYRRVVVRYDNHTLEGYD